MQPYKERFSLQSETAMLVNEFLDDLKLPARFSLQDLCRASAKKLGMDLRTYRTRVPAGFGGLGLAAQGRTIILVDRRRGLLAEDYTILHELGHLVLGHLEPGHAAGDWDEIQADIFADTVLQRMLRRTRRSSTTSARLKRFFSL